ncbi:hypothetical protein M3J09_003376 [Ascochyta lentis]
MQSAVRFETAFNLQANVSRDHVLPYFQRQVGLWDCPETLLMFKLLTHARCVADGVSICKDDRRSAAVVRHVDQA